MKTLFILTVIYLARSVVSMEGEAPPSASEERKLIRNPENGQLFYLGNFGAGGSKTCGKILHNIISTYFSVQLIHEQWQK